MHHRCSHDSTCIRKFNHKASMLAGCRKNHEIMVSDIAERDAPPGIPPEEPQIVDGPSHIPHRYMGGDKRQRNQVPAQTVKPLFVTPDPVPTGAVSSGAQLPSSIKESRAIQPASSQAPSLTLQQALTNRQSGPLASNAHSGNMSLPQVPTLKHQSNFQPSPAVSSPVVLPGSGQVLFSFAVEIT